MKEGYSLLELRFIEQLDSGNYAGYAKNLYESNQKEYYKKMSIWYQGEKENEEIELCFVGIDSNASDLLGSRCGNGTHTNIKSNSIT